MFTANFRSLPRMGLQMGSPSRLTRTAGVWLKWIVGGSALTPSTSFGVIWLRSTLASTRSSAITRSCCGIDASISATTSRICSRATVGKWDSVILRTEKLTSRSAVDTLVSASILMLPRAGFVAPFAAQATAA